jgi:ABC-2 type transport system permease protein
LKLLLKSTILMVACHEIRLHWRDRTLPIAVASLTVLLLVAGLVTRQNQAERDGQRAWYQSQVRRNWLEQPDRHPHRASHYGYLAFRAPGAASFVDQGVEGFLGNSIFLEAHRQNTANFSEANLSGGLMRFGVLSPALIILLLTPLVIFFLGYSIVSGEREGGTLQQLFAQGATGRQILLGKSLALFLMGLALILPGLLPIIFRYQASDSGGGSIVTQIGWRLAGLALVYVVYLLICCVGCVIVSTLSRRSRSALLVLILCWVTGGVFLPRGLAAAGERLATLPSRAEFDARLEREMAQQGDSHNPDDPHFRQLREETLRRYNVTRINDLPFNYGAFVMLESERISSEIFRRHYLELLATIERQNDLAVPFGLINPYLAVRPISAALAGSDHHHFAAFQLQAEQFRYEMIQQLNRLHLEEIRYENDRAQRVSREHWADFPEFMHHPPGWREVLATIRLPLGALAIWLIGALALLLKLRPEKIR